MKQGEKKVATQHLFQFDIVKENTYRSQSLVNMTDDMIRVVLDMTRHEWSQLLKARKSNTIQDARNKTVPDLLARGERTIMDDQDIFYMGSCSPKEGGTTECGRLGINHKMKRFGPMSTKCINSGCDACC